MVIGPGLTANASARLRVAQAERWSRGPVSGNANLKNASAGTGGRPRDQGVVVS
jgi:hypothetical protein